VVILNGRREEYSSNTLNEPGQDPMLSLQREAWDQSDSLPAFGNNPARFPTAGQGPSLGFGEVNHKINISSQPWWRALLLVFGVIRDCRSTIVGTEDALLNSRHHGYPELELL
jgi:hypothetical protein